MIVKSVGHGIGEWSAILLDASSTDVRAIASVIASTGMHRNPPLEKHTLKLLQQSTPTSGSSKHYIKCVYVKRGASCHVDYLKAARCVGISFIGSKATGEELRKALGITRLKNRKV